MKQTQNTNSENIVTLYFQKDGFKPVLVLDKSKPIYETITYETEVIEPGMRVISERYNPFFKQTAYKVEKTILSGWECVYYSQDYLKAERFAKSYAKRTGLKFER